MNSSVSTLFHEAERLDNRSLDVFIDNILSLRVRREVSNIQKEEASLLEKINKSLSLKQVERFRILNQRRLEDTISTTEYDELLVLLEKTEKLNSNRIKHLVSLARLRNVSVLELMNQLNISPING
jgi:hemerythrin-like domain-containing protein